MHDHEDKLSKKRFILPFVVPATDRLKDFTKNMEMAAILYLAESNREKGESHILKKPDEKLVFITEVRYPIWLIPYNGATLLFDGLGVTSHSLIYDVIPEVEIFNEDIRENKKKTEAYTATLSRNADYFKDFTDKEGKTIEGLIAAPILVEDFTTYLIQMKETHAPLATKAVLRPLVEDREIQAGINQLSNLRNRIHEDIENIDASMKLLNTATLERTKAIRREIRVTQEKHDKQIEKAKIRVSRRTMQIQKKYQRKITGASRRFKTRIERLRKNKVKHQKTLRHLRTEAERCETRIQSWRRQNRKRAEVQWTLKLKRIENQLPTLRGEITGILKEIQDIEAAQKLELAQLKKERDARIETANKLFYDLQASKEAEIMMKRQEIVMLEDTTSQITNQMRDMAETKIVTLAKFDTIALPGRRQVCALVYAPLYLVRYEKEDRKRYVVYPPSIVGGLGILTRMKGALGAEKMKALLQPRSEAITIFLNQLLALMEKNAMLEKEVTESGIRNSILMAKQLRIGVKKGLKELEKENWVSKKELQTFSKILYIYA